MQALPPAAFFLFLEAAVGGTIALFFVHLRRETPRGFALFTGWTLWICGALALWLRLVYPPDSQPGLDAPADAWFAAERVLLPVYLVLFACYLVLLQRRVNSLQGSLAPVIPVLGLCSLWSASLVAPSGQLFGLAAPLADLAGALALGGTLVALSLGHWYLVSPTLSTRPLIRLTFLSLGALLAQLLLEVPFLLLPFTAGNALSQVLATSGLFLVVRFVFGLIIPPVLAFLCWRTERIRSLDSATGILYIMAALILTGEIVARALFFLTGVAL